MQKRRNEIQDSPEAINDLDDVWMYIVEELQNPDGANVRVVMNNVKVYIRGWLGYFAIADMKTTMQNWDEWLRRRLRMYIWKQWKKPKTRVENLMKLGMPDWQAYRNGNTRKGYWTIARSGILTHTITNKRLAQAGYYSILDRYKSLHLCG